MAVEIENILLPRGHPFGLEVAKESLTGSRVRLCGIISAVLMVLWIPVDIHLMPWEVIAKVVYARMAAALALAAISRAAELPQFPKRYLLAALFAVLITFYAWANDALSGFLWSDEDLVVRTGYEEFPVLFAALISFFPLTAAESALCAGVILLATLMCSNVPLSPAAAFVTDGSLLILLGTSALSGVAAGSLLLFAWRLTDASTHDQMTTCMKREPGLQLLESLFLTAQRTRMPLSVLFVDLDNFKSVNDRFGHDKGDAVLANAGAHLRQALRRQDFVIRWGGEEFLVVLPATAMAAAKPVVTRIGECGLGHRPDGAAQTASCGCAETIADACGSVKELVAIADSRMYAAKKNGRNYVFLQDGGFPFIGQPLQVEAREAR